MSHITIEKHNLSLQSADIEKMEDMIALNITASLAYESGMHLPLSPSSAGILADIPLGWLHTLDGFFERDAPSLPSAPTVHPGVASEKALAFLGTKISGEGFPGP
jgi:hypothetical protein